jgi:hypothetical protein
VAVSKYNIGEQALPAPWFVDNVRTYSIPNQLFGPIQRFPQRLKSVRIVAFAFLLDGGVSEAEFEEQRLGVFHQIRLASLKLK